MIEISSGLRSTFTFELIDGVFVVTDLDDGQLQFQACSVTNDAENVIKYLVKVAGLISTSDGFDGHQRVVYCDTQGRWDELLHQNGKFAGFGHIGCKSRDVAIRVAKEAPSVVPKPVKQEDDPWV